MTDDVVHYGTPRHSGRYPWGSGGEHLARNRDFLGMVASLEAKGMSPKEIATGLGITIAELRAGRSIASNEIRKANIAQAVRLQNKGLSNVAIGQRMLVGESTVRSLLSAAAKDKEDILKTVSDLLRSKVADGSYLDIGSGTENHLGITSTRLSTAVAILKSEGYVVHTVQVDQQGTSAGKKTSIKVLAPPGTEYRDIVRNTDKIKTIAAYSEDGGRTVEHVKPPVNISSKRIDVRYAEQGGSDADGVIYLRPGVRDLSLGSAKYAQVRIAVDGTHYLKGMAVYKADLPKGVDIQFNTNKKNTGNKLDAMKAQKDEENPFGSTVRQRKYKDAEGNEHQSPLNIVNEEGNWKDWSRNLSSQVLSKQPVSLAKRQLDLALASKRDELDEISKLTNPVVKSKLLEGFADGADSASVHLKAAALPRQENKVILPITSLKEHEVYAPTFRDGEKVVLVRHPHGGTFEIPEVTVNNKNPEARKTLGTDAIDAIGIHPKTAARLSGADFDGDTVLVIPNNRKEVKTTAPLAGLHNFDPQRQYPAYEGMKPMTARSKQQQMGDVSNLITDMTIKGAKPDELAAAVRHSMVVIDAEKHNLNYKQSAVDNGIASLKEKYQGRGESGRLAGASTIVSRAKSEIRVEQRKLRRASEGGPINLATGEKEFVKTGATQTDKAGRVVLKTEKSTKLAETRDARTLSSGMPIENVYADHSNAMKGLANEARKELVMTGGIQRSTSAAKTYAPEVAKLTADLNEALKNSPLERQAQLVASAQVEARRQANPHMDSADLKKIKGQELDKARARVGAKKQVIPISDKQWEAIQAGAVSTHKLEQILNNADQDQVRKLATPRAATVMTPSKLALAKARLASGYTPAEVADSLGIAVSTINSAIAREGG